jgi:hypothetical protein
MTLSAVSGEIRVKGLQTKSQPNWIARCVLWLAVVLVASISLYELKPPAALGLDAPPGQFSAARAMEHVRQIAQRPHFIGTHENDAVRDYLVQQLKALGGSVEVESAVGVHGHHRSVFAASVQNVVATFRGNANDRAVMLASHYDSVEHGPGASDDGSGVASILETIRALKVGPGLKNDVLVLFTDGEEVGLLGAAAFVSDHPDLAERVGVVLNFDQRGSSGPGLLYETSENNGWFIEQFAKAAPYPMGSSLMYTVYRQMPVDTDMTLYKGAGLAGLNFAFIGRYQDYHTRLDTPKNLDPRSLQHTGSYALALTRHFGNLNLQSRRQPDRVYFNWLGSSLIEYRAWVVWALLLLALALGGVVLLKGFRRQLIASKKVAVGLGGFLLLASAVVGSALLAWWIVGLFMGHTVLAGDVPSNLFLLAGLLLAGIAGGTAVLGWLTTKIGWINLAAGQLLGFGLVTACVSFRLPGASYALEWPLVFALAGLLLAVVKPVRTAAFLGMIGSIPAILLIAPLIYLSLVLLDLNTVSVITAALLLGLLMAVLSPLLVHLVSRRRWTPAILLIGSFVFLVTGKEMSQFSATHPMHDTVFYSLNADQHTAAWLSYDDMPDNWTAQFLGDQPRKGQQPAFTIGSDFTVLASDAPVLVLEAPVARVTSDDFRDGVRTLLLHLSSPRHANAMLVKFSAEADILSLKFNSRKYSIGTDRGPHSLWDLRYFALPTDGFDLEVRLSSQGPIRCWVGDRSLGLPQIPARSYRLRPNEVMSWYGSDVTVVGRQYTF